MESCKSGYRVPRVEKTSSTVCAVILMTILEDEGQLSPSLKLVMDIKDLESKSDAKILPFLENHEIFENRRFCMLDKKSRRHRIFLKIDF